MNTKASEAYQFNEFQLKWLEALESGAYGQAKHRLYTGAGYCCLGIGCLVAGISPVRHTDEDEGRVSEWFEFDGEAEAAPDALLAALKLRGRLADIDGGASTIGPTSVTNLAHANDGGATFAEIAAFIRANPEKVFLP